ncbi:MAG: hypothetical protein ACLQBD_20025 [Syntrophobacteraceae bacterium]
MGQDEPRGAWSLQRIRQDSLWDVLPTICCTLIRDAAFWGESVKPSIDSIIRRLVKVGARVVYHAGKWYVHVASAFPLARYYRILFA